MESFPTIYIENLKIYHITPTNIEKNHKEFKLKLDSPMYFGLTEEFTRYNDNGRTIWKDYIFEHLKFKINKKVKIAHIQNKNIYKISELINYLKKHNYDGFLAIDDFNIEWYKICIFNPESCLDKEYTILDNQLLESIYDYEDYVLFEQKIIKKLLDTK